MHVICSYCGRYIKENKPFQNKGIMHRVCLNCFVPTSIVNGAYSYDEYLNTFDTPTLILDTSLNVLASNNLVWIMLHKSFECLEGVMLCEALDCSKSKLSGGCSSTVNCEKCIIRTLIMKTLQMEISFHYECVELETERGVSTFLISTLFYGDVLQIIFEDGRIHEIESC